VLTGAGARWTQNRRGTEAAADEVLAESCADASVVDPFKRAPVLRTT